MELNSQALKPKQKAKMEQELIKHQTKLAQLSQVKEASQKGSQIEKVLAQSESDEEVKSESDGEKSMVKSQVEPEWPVQ